MSFIGKIFGSEIRKQIKNDPIDSSKAADRIKSFVPKKEDDENVYAITAGGSCGYYYDIDGTQTTNDKELILKYRIAAEHPECDTAINDIVNETIITDEMGASVEIITDKINYTEDIKKCIRDEFDHVVNLLDFNEFGSELFRRWYVDGRAYFHIVPLDDGGGIEELRYIDPTSIRKVKEIQTKKDPLTGVQIEETVSEYYIFDNGGSEGLKIHPDSIIYVSSGILDSTRTKTLSHVHKSLKLVNQLVMLEDALIVYRLARAPERRVFYIDCGNLSSQKSGEHIRKMMAQYRNKVVYDATTGEVRNDRHQMSMVEDFWLPRREGGRGTEIDTLPGGDNLGEIDDILFFQKKLYKSLNVPIGRLDSESQFAIGRATEISREEVKFQKFITRLRKRFSYILIDALRMQLLLKGIITEEDWAGIKEGISIDFRRDNHFAELKDIEVIRERMETLQTMEEYVGKFYSVEWIRRNVLRQSESEIEEMNAQMTREKADGDDDDDDY